MPAPARIIDSLPGRLPALVLLLTIVLWSSSLRAQVPAPAADADEDTRGQFRVELIVFEYGDSLAGTSEDWPRFEMPEVPIEDDPDADAAREEPVTAGGEPVQAASAVVGETDGETDGDDEQPEVGMGGETDTDEQGWLTLEDEADTGIDNTIRDAVPAKPSFRFRPVPEDEFQLAEIRNRLSRTSGYEPLLHVAWQQPGYDPETARAIDLERLGELPERLSGDARLYRSRFLHLVLDLTLLAPPDEKPGPGAAAIDLTPEMPGADSVAMLEPRLFRLSEGRKLRSGELHYYDHPRLGALALVTPVETEKEPVQEPSGVDAAAAPVDSGDGSD